MRLFLIKYRWLVIAYIGFEMVVSSLTYKHYLPEVNALLAQYLPH